MADTMSDDVSRDDDKPTTQEQKSGGFWKRMFTGADDQPQSDADTAPATEASDAVTTTHSTDPSDDTLATTAETTASTASNEEGFWKRMKQGMSKTRKGLGKGLADLLVGAKEIDDEIGRPAYQSCAGMRPC